MSMTLLVIANAAAIAAVVAWKTKRVTRFVAGGVTVAAVVVPVMLHGATAKGMVLPVAAALWVTGTVHWLYIQWRTSQRKNPPHGEKRQHLNKDWSPKRGYPNQSEAIAVASRQGHQEGSHLNAYRCPVCEEWHVGHGNAA